MVQFRNFFCINILTFYIKHSVGHGSESEKRNMYSPYVTILDTLLREIEAKYIKNHKITEMKEKYNSHSSRNRRHSRIDNIELPGKNSEKTFISSLANINAAKDGKFKHILSHFFSENEAGINAFDISFPGFWNDETSFKGKAKDSDLNGSVSSIVVKMLNIITAVGINVSIHLDDFQVKKIIL